MSYCVNCGVELDSSNLACPLCNTPVLNPTEILFQTNSENKMETEIHKQTRAPFPHERGTVEVVKRRDVAILLSVVLVSTGLTCGLLNLLVFTSSLWSVPIFGFLLSQQLFISDFPFIHQFYLTELPWAPTSFSSLT